jgi:1,4-alpha-glucan branching enzyme
MPALRFDEHGRCVAEFRLPQAAAAKRAWLVGEFNDWSKEATPMRPADDGSLSARVVLEPGRSYRFRYYLGDGRWENDWDADDYVPNEFGGADSVLIVPSLEERKPPSSSRA